MSQVGTIRFSSCQELNPECNSELDPFPHVSKLPSKHTSLVSGSAPGDRDSLYWKRTVAMLRCVYEQCAERCDGFLTFSVTSQVQPYAGQGDLGFWEVLLCQDKLSSLARQAGLALICRQEVLINTLYPHMLQCQLLSRTPGQPGQTAGNKAYAHNSDLP